MAACPPLAGCRVWLTRPIDQAGAWAEAFEYAGATVTREPLLAIAPPRDRQSARAALAAAASADIVIATSANAIAGAGERLGAWRPSGRLLAVGAATAAAFRDFVGRDVEQPRNSDSEGLLAHLADTDLAGRQIAILAGEGGRPTLAEGLSEAGASVAHIALYRRLALTLPTARLDTLLERHDVLVVTSSAAWQALIAACNTALKQRLAGLSLVAPSVRVVQHTEDDIDWRYPPVVLKAMDIAGARAALTRAWLARQ